VFTSSRVTTWKEKRAKAAPSIPKMSASSRPVPARRATATIPEMATSPATPGPNAVGFSQS